MSTSFEEKTTLFENWKGGAFFSDDRKYRYMLWRHWDPYKPKAVFIMLNPSTADEKVNDPTIERCLRRAAKMGFGKMEVLNLFAFRATDPKKLKVEPEPIGLLNDQWIWLRSGMASAVFIAWGNHGSYLNRSTEVLKILWGLNVPVYHFGKTKSAERSLRCRHRRRRAG